MTLPSDSARTVRIHHAVFGCPNDRGFKKVSSSFDVSDADYSTIAGLGDQGPGELLQGQALAFTRLAKGAVLIVTEPDGGGRKRAGSVVSHVFLLDDSGYDAMGRDPLTFYDLVKDRCGNTLPDREAAEFHVQLPSVARHVRLASLPVKESLAVQLAAAIADRLLGGPSSAPLRVADPLQVLSVIIGMSPRHARRSLSFATSAFSRDGHRLGLLVTRENVGESSTPARPTNRAPRDLVEEAQYLLTLDPEAAAERIDSVDSSWPEGAPVGDLTIFLAELRKADSAMRSGDPSRILDQARTVMDRLGKSDLVIRVACSLLSAACRGRMGGVHDFERLDGVLDAFQKQGALDRVIGQIDQQLEGMPGRSMIELVACVERYCAKSGRPCRLRRSTDELVKAELASDSGVQGLEVLLVWLIENRVTLSIESRRQIEVCAWLRHDGELKRRAALVQGDFNSAKAYFDSRIDMLRQLIQREEFAVKCWFDEHKRDWNSSWFAEYEACGGVTAVLKMILNHVSDPGAQEAMQRMIDRATPGKVMSAIPQLMSADRQRPAEFVGVLVEALAGGRACRDAADKLRLLQALHAEDAKVAPEVRHSLAVLAITTWSEKATHDEVSSPRKERAASKSESPGAKFPIATSSGGPRSINQTAFPTAIRRRDWKRLTMYGLVVVFLAVAVGISTWYYFAWYLA